MTGGRDLVLAVDCSTSGAKAVVFGSDGRSLSSGRRTFTMAKTPEGRHEQDAHDWWRATSAVIAEAMASVDSSRVAAITVTHQRETFVCVDAAGEPLRPAIVWADKLATDRTLDHQRLQRRLSGSDGPGLAEMVTHTL
ncbi:MAG: carbohydrate kinase [Mycobacterium sp.]|nr:carbohydrate kinase [Mycobacterium sp.]